LNLGVFVCKFRLLQQGRIHVFIGGLIRPVARDGVRGLKHPTDTVSPSSAISICP